MNQIQAIYREEGKLSELTSDEQLIQRQLVVKSLVDAFLCVPETDFRPDTQKWKSQRSFYLCSEQGTLPAGIS